MTGRARLPLAVPCLALALAAATPSASRAAEPEPFDCGATAPAPVVLSGSEERVLALFRPFALGTPSGGLRIGSVSIARSVIHVGFTYHDAPGSLRLVPAVCRPDAGRRSKSFAIEVAAPDAASPGAALLVHAIQSADDGSILSSPVAAAPTIPWPTYLPLLLLLGLLSSRPWVRVACLGLLSLSMLAANQPRSDGPGLGLLWALVPLAVGGVVHTTWHLDRRLVMQAALVTLLALAVRFVADGLPANWYTALPFPPDVHGQWRVTDVSGFNAWPAWLDRVSVLDATALLALQRLLSAATCGLLVIALGLSRRAAGPGRSPWARATPWLAGALLATDGIQAQLGASDAVHVSVAFGFALSAAVLALAPAWRRFGPLALAVSLLIAAWTRLETLPFLLALPLLADPRLRWRRPRTWVGPRGAHVLLGLVLIPAAWALVGSSGDQNPLGLGWLGWVASLDADGAGLIDTHGGPWAPLPALLLAATIGALLAARRRHFAAGLLLLGCLVAFAFRYNSAYFLAHALMESIAWARHDILLHLLLLCLAAEGVARVGDWLAQVTPRPRLAAGAAGLVAAAAILYGALRALPLLERRQDFQAEYEFLVTHLPTLDARCATVVVATVDDRETRLLDVGLVFPHPLLSRALPDHDFVLVSPSGELPADANAPCYRYFRGAQCGLQTGTFAEWVRPEHLRQLAATCARMEQFKGAPLVEATPLVGHVVTPPRVQSPMTLGLYELEHLPR